MATFWTALFGFSAVLIGINFFFALVQFGLVRTVHPPKRQSFAAVRASEQQFQTVVAPAIGALASGLFVSISASFFYSSIVGDGGDNHRAAGIVLFLVAGLSLSLTIGIALRRGIQATELARNPFTIRAAAEEYTTDPLRGPVEPKTLSQNLSEWTQYRAARSLQIESDVKAPRLDKVLDNTIDSHGFWSALLDSLKIFIFAVVRFPLRFGWPVVCLFFVPVASIGVISTGKEIAGAAVPRLIAIALVAVGLAMLSVIVYGVARGNNARLWHRVNRKASLAAEVSIAKAATAHDRVKAENELRKRVLKEADRLFKDSSLSESRSSLFTLSLGRIRVELVHTHRPPL